MEGGTIKGPRVLWILTVLTCCMFTNTSGQGVADLTIGTVTESTIQISWTANGQWDYYTIDVRTMDGSMAPGYPINATNLLVTLEDLEPETAYTITVVPYQTNGNVGTTTNGTATTAITFDLVLQTDTSLGLTWVQPEGNDYDMVRLIASFPPSNQAVDLPRDSTSHTFIELRPGREHLVTLYKLNGGVQGEVVYQFTFQTLPETVDPGTIDFNDNNDGDLIIDWAAPNGIVDSYEITVTPGGFTVPVPDGMRTYTFDSLEPSTVYTFAIRTITGGFGSATTASASRITGPAAPEGIVISPYSRGVEITWNPVANASLYDVEIRDASGTLIDSTSDPQTEYSLQLRLQEATSYTVSITSLDTTSVDRFNLFGRTAVVDFNTTARFATVVGRTTTSITLGTLHPDDFVTVDSARFDAGSNGEATVSGLSAGECYRFSIFNGNIILRDFIQECTVPGSPNITLERGNPSDSNLLMNIMAPTGGSESFFVTLSSSSGSADTLAVSDVSIPVNFTDLDAFTEYTVTVVTVFMNLNSSEEQASAFTALSPPSDFMVTSKSHIEVTLEWEAVAGAQIYQLSQSPGNPAVKQVQGTMYTFTDLDPDRLYTFTIISTRSGDFDSDPASASTRTDMIPNGEILVTDVTSTLAFLQWRSYGEGPYYLTYEPEGAISDRTGIIQDEVEIEIFGPGRGRIINVTLNSNSVPRLARAMLRGGPESPANVTIETINVLNANISWTPPTAPHDGFEIFATNEETGERTLKETVPASDNVNHNVVTGLFPATNFTFEVGTYLDPSGPYPRQISDQARNPMAVGRTDGPEAGDLLLVDCGTDFLQVAWGVSPNTTYDHWIMPTDSPAPVVDLDAGLVTYRGLQPGRNYTVYVNDSDGQLLSVSSFTVPPSPGEIIAVSSTYTTLELSWDEPNVPGIDYEVEVTSEACGGLPPIRQNTTAANITLSSLRIATVYTVSVTAVVSDGKRNEATATVSTDSTGVEEGMVSIVDSTHAVSPDNQGVIILFLSETNFDLHVSPLNDQLRMDARCEDSSAQEYNLTRGTTFNFTLTTSTGSSSTIYRTDPDIIMSFQAQGEQPTEFSVGWDSPASGTYDGALLTISSLVHDEFAPPGQQRRVNAPVTMTTFDGLWPLTTYTVVGRAFFNASADLGLEEQFGMESSFMVNTTSLPINETLIIDTDESLVTLIHGGDPGSLTGFMVVPGDGIDVTPFGNNRLNFSDLMPGVLYNATLIFGSEGAVSVLFRLPPLMPSVTVLSTTETSMLLRIDAGSFAEKYSINITSISNEYCPFQDSLQIDYSESVNYTIENLPPSLMYSIDVWAEVQEVEGGIEAASSAATSLNVSTDMVARNKFTVIDSTDDSVTLAWFSDTASNLTRIASTTRDGEMTDIILEEMDCSSPRIMEIPLPNPGTVYTIAYSSNGIQRFNYTTRTDPDAVIIPGVLKNQTSLNVGWVLPPMGDLDRISLTLTSAEDKRYFAPGVTFPDISNMATSFVISGLIPLTNYTISVKTILDATDDFEEQESEESSGLEQTDEPASGEIFEYTRNETAIGYVFASTRSANVTISPGADGLLLDANRVILFNLLPGQLYSGEIEITTPPLLDFSFRLRPSPPDVTLVNTTESDMTISLSPGSGVLDRYIITVQCGDAAQDACQCKDMYNVSGESTTFLINDLRPGVDYNITVVAWAGPELPGTSLETKLEESTLSINENASFTILEQTISSVFLAWTANGPVSVTMEFWITGGYVLNDTFIYDGCFSSYTLEVEDLLPASVYRFTRSDTDDFILIRTDPLSIESCSVVTTSSGYTLTWSVPPTAKNDGYIVTVTDSQGNVLQDESVAAGGDLEVTMRGIMPETELNLVVNSLLEADPVDGFSMQLGNMPCMLSNSTAPLAPGELSLQNVTTDTIPFAVGNASSAPGFQGYNASIEPAGPVLNFNDETLLGVFSNVVPGQLYVITSVVLGTDIVLVHRERAKPLPPNNATSPIAGATSVSISWNLPLLGVFSFFRITINPTFDTDQNSIMINNLLPETSYNVSIVAISGTGPYQQISDPIQLEVVTGNLTSGELVFINVMSASITAVWSGNAVTYTVQVTGGMDTNSTLEPTSGTNTITVREGISPAQVYLFEVFASTTSIASGSVRTNPETPQRPRLVSLGPFSAVFDWNPTSSNFSAYLVHSAPFSFQRELVATIPRMGAELMYSEECLTPDTEYNFEISTVLYASGGFGEQTSDDAQSIRFTTDPYDISEPHISSRTNTSLTVTWLDAAADGQQVCLQELCTTQRGSTPTCFPTNQSCPLFYNFEGLVPGRRYVISVEYNDGSVQDVIFTQSKPNPPRFLNATSIRSDTIRVNLLPPEGEFDGYELSYMPFSSSDPIMLGPDTRDYILDGLESNTMYTIYVFAYSGSDSLRVDGDVAMTTITTEQAILEATNIMDDEIFLFWSSASLPISSFQSFRLSHSSRMVSGSISIPMNPQPTLNRDYAHAISNLVPGDLVTIELETVTAGGQATLIDTIVQRTNPGAVSMFNTERVADSPTSIRVLWRQPSSGLYWGYLVDYSPADGDQMSPIELGRDEEEVTITGLQFYQEYNVSISAIMGRGGSYTESEPQMETVMTGRGDENEINIRSLNSTSVTFTWWGTGADNFTVRLNSDGSCAAASAVMQDVMAREATFDDLIPGAGYSVRVDGSPLTGEDAEFIAVPDQVSDIQVKSINSSAITLAWTPPAGCYDRIEISYSPDTCTNPSPIVLNREDGNEYTLTPLQANEDYELSFVTLQLTERSMPYTTRVRTTCPEQEKLNIGAVQSDSISLTWGNTTNAAATGFTLTATPESSSPITRQLSLGVLEYTFTDLMSGVEYTIVLSVDGTGISDTITQTTCPSQAQNVSVIFFTQTCLTFVWLPPLGNFDSYEVFVRHGNPPVAVHEGTVYPNQELNVQVENLDAGTLYTIGVVTVVNGIKGEPALITQRTIDNLVMTSAVPGDSQAITVSWQPTPGAAFYNLVYIPDNGNFSTSDLTNLTGQEVTIGSLTPGKRYVFILSVHYSDGRRDLLAQTSYSLSPVMPAPTASSQGPSAGEIMLNIGTGVYETYELELSPSEQTYSGARASPRIVNVAGLEPNTTYRATVTFRTGDALSEMVEVDFQTIPLHGGELFTDEVTTDSVRLVWAEITNTERYAIRLDNRIFITSQTSYILTGLDPGTAYNPILLVRRVGMSDFDEVDTEHFVVTRPEEVLFFEVKEITTNNVTLVWNGPSSNVDMYTLYCDACGITEDLNSTSTEFTIQGFPINDEFLVTLYPIAQVEPTVGRNALSYGEPSTLNIIVDPSEPGRIDVTEINSTSIAISWTEIAGITDYIVTLSQATDNSVLYSDIVRDRRTASFRGLVPGREYVIEIALQCAGDVLTLRQFTLPLEPECAVFTLVTRDSITVQWSRPNSELLGYQITYDDGFGPYQPIDVFDRSLMTLEKVIPGLTDGPSVEVNISTLAGAGMRQARSNPATISPSSLGSAFNITSLTTTSIEFGWYELPQASVYEVCIQPPEGNATCRNLTERSTTFSDLFPGEAYTLSIGWDSACGVSLTFNTVPSGPANLTLGNITSCAGEIVWDIPETRYDFFEITYSPEHGFTDSPSHIYRMDVAENETSLSFQFVGILPDTEYNVTVVTVSGALDVRSEPSYISFRTASSANGSIIVTEIFEDAIQVGWGNDTQDYVYIRFNLEGENRTDCENESLCSVGNSSETYNITQLLSGQKYIIFVDQDGVCETLEQYTRPLPPVNVTVAERTLTSLNITWLPPGNETMFDQYHVSYARGDDLTNATDIGFLDPSMTWVFLDNLTPRTLYEITVSTVVGEGDAQAFSDSPIFFAYTAEANESITVFEYNTTSMMITWPVVPSDINVSVSIEPSDGVLDLNIGNRSARVTGLVPGRLYNISVFPFETISQRTIPLPPFNISLCPDDPITFFTICITFTPPVEGDYDMFLVSLTDGFMPVQTRRRRAIIRHGGFFDVRRLAADELTTVIDDLIPNTEYTIHVDTVSGSGEETEEISTFAEVTGKTLMIGETDLVFTDVNSTYFRVWFNRVTNFTGNYTVTVQPGDIQMIVTHDAIPHAVFENVSSSTVYNVTVEVPSGDVASGSIRTYPDSASNPMLIVDDEISLIASWDPPDKVTIYNEIILSLWTNGSVVQSFNISANETEFVFECLDVDMEYTVEITSVLRSDGMFDEQYALEDPLMASASTGNLHPANESRPSIVDSAITSSSIAVRWGRLGQDGFSVCLVEYCRQFLDTPYCLTNGSDTLCSIEAQFDSLDPGKLYVVSYMDTLNIPIELEKVRTKPLAPSSVTIEAVSSRQIEIRWSPPPNIAEMELKFFMADPRTLIWERRIDNDGEYDIYGLDAETRYTIELSSIGRTGAGDGSDDERLPGEPLERTVETSARILSVVNTPNALTFLWNEQPNPATFTSYLIMSDTISETVPKQAGGTSTSYEKSISNLTPGELYTVSLFLQPLSTFPDPLDTIIVRTAPNRPEELRVVESTITTLRVEWDAPASGLYRGFEVDIDPPTFLQNLPTTVGRDIRGFSFEGLSHNTPHTVSVTTIMGMEGLEERSQPATTSGPTEAGSGDEVYILEVLTTSALIGWAFTGPVTVEQDGVQITASAISSYRINGLAPGVQYTVTVAGTTDIIVTTVPERPEGLELERVGPYSLHWNVDTSLNNLNYERLEVSYTPESTQTASPFDISRCTEGSFSLEGLQPDTEYAVSVTAISGNTRSEVLTRYAFTTCAPEGRLHVVSLTSDELNIAWGPVEGAQGYLLQLIRNGAVDDSISPSGDVQSGRFRSLIPATNYTLQLFVIRGIGGAEETDSLEFVTNPIQPGPITLQSTTQTRLAFSWTDSPSNFDFYELSIAGGDMPEPRIVGMVYPGETNEFNVGALLPDTTYTIRIFTVFFGLRSLASEDSFNTDEQVLEFSVDDSQNLTITWPAQDGADSYRLIYTTTNRDTNSIAQATMSTTLSIDNLLAGAIYNFRLIAIATDGTESEVADADFVQSPLTPAATVAEVGSTKALLTFTPNEGIFDDYVVMLSSPTDTCGARQPVFTLRREACPQLLLTDLFPDTMYTAQVFARTGERGFSLASETEFKNFTTMSLVNEGEVSKVGSNFIDIVWETNEVDQYLLHYSYPGSGVTSTIVPYSTELNEYSFDGLMPGTEYSITIFSLVGLQEDGSLDLTQYTKPGPISDLVLTPVENTINLTWTAPSTPYDGYLVCWYSPGGSDSAWLEADALSYPWVIGTPNEEHVVSVATFVGDKMGVYELSNKLTDFITLTETSPLILEALSLDAISVSWVTIPGVQDYTLSYSPADGNEPATQEIDESFAMTDGLNSVYNLNFTGLTPGREYTFTVIWPLAFNYSTDSIHLEPLPVHSPTVTNTSSCNLLFQWCLPEGDYDNTSITIEPPVTMYRMDNGSDNTCDYQTVYLDGLDPDTMYNVSVEVVSGDETSEVLVISGATEDRGGAINVTDVTTSSINITWSEVLGENEFIVQWQVEGASVPQNDTVSGARELHINTLQPGDQVTITVLWDFLCELPQVVQYTKPLPVNNLTFVEATITEISLNWQAPLDGEWDMYQIEYSPVGSAEAALVMDVSTTSATLSGLDAGTLYEIAVYTWRGMGDNYERSTPEMITAMTAQQNSEELLLQDRTTTTISVLWGNTTRPEVLGFVVSISLVGSSAATSETVGLADELSVVFTGLVPGTAYKIYLLVDLAEETDVRVNDIEITTLPAMPGEINCTYSTQSLIRFVWGATLDGNFNGYTISIQADGEEETYLDPVDANEPLEVTADYLMVDTVYVIRVRSVVGDLAGEPSMTTCMTDRAIIEPGFIDARSIALYWTGHTGSSAYEVTYTPADEGNPAPPISLDNSTQTLFLDDLSPGTVYRFILFGFNGGIRRQITGLTYVLAPLPIEEILIRFRGPTLIRLRLRLPRRGRFPRLRWRLRRRVFGLGVGSDGSAEVVLETDACPELSFTDLLPNTTYSVTVNSIADDGTTLSEPTTLHFNTTSFEEGQISFNEITRTTISFAWGEVLESTVGPFTNYLLNLKDESNSDVTNVEVPTSEPREHIFTGLMPGSLYLVELIVNGNRRRTGLTYTRPDPPTDIIISDLTTTSLTLAWMPPSTSHAGYSLCWTYNGTDSIELGRGVTERTLSDLEPGAEYLVSLAAVVGVGIDQIASEKFTTTIRLLPPVELHVNVTDFNTTAISIAWSTDITLSDIDRYVISYWQTGNNASLLQITVSDPDQTEYTITGLVPGTEYSFEVDAEGTVQAVRTMGTSQYTYPETVAEIRVIPSYTCSVQLEWDRPAGNLTGYIFHYDVTQGMLMGGPDMDNIPLNDTEDTVTYLLEGLEKEAGFDYISLKVMVTTVAGPEDSPINSLGQASKVLDVNVITITILDRGHDFIQAELNSSITSGLESITTGLYGDGEVTDKMIRNCTTLNCSSFEVEFNTDLISGTLYTIYAGVVQSNGREVVPLLARAATIPESAVNPRFTIIGENFVVLVWDNPDGMIDSYNVSHYPTDDVTNLRFKVVEADSEGNELRIENLDAGMNYSFTIVSLLEVEADTLEMGAPVQVFTVVGEQGNFNITAFNETTITIEWQILDVDEYILSYDAEEGRSGNVTVPSTEPNTYTFVDLTPGTQYTIGVKPGIYTVLDKTQYTVPYPPSNFRVTSVVAKSVTVSWDPPEEGGVGMYTITYSPSGGQPGSPYTPLSTSMTFSRLTPITDYNFTITNTFRSLESRSVTIMTRTSAQELNLVAMPVAGTDNTQFIVTWDDLDSTSVFDQYCVRYSPYENRPLRQQESFVANRTVRSAEFYGLDPGREYTVNVSTCNIGGDITDDGSESIVFRLAPDAVDEIRIRENTLSARRVTLEWDELDGVRDQINVTLDPSREGSIGGAALPYAIGSESTSVTIENLAAGKRYEVGLRADSGAESSSVTSLVFYTLPDPPQNLVLSDIEETTARVTWSLPAEVNIPISHVIMMTAPETETRTLSLAPNSTVISNLVPGQTYNVSLASVIRPTNQLSVTSVEEISPLFLMRPAAPTRLSASNGILTVVTVSWQPSEGIVARYQYTYVIAGSSSSMSNMTTNTSIELTGLDPSRLYNFRLWAESDHNVGTETKSSDVVNLDFSTKPNRPISFAATSVTATSITWTWLPPSSIQLFVIAIKDDTGASVNTRTVNGLEHTESNLNSFRTYSATLQSIFNGVPSDAVSASDKTLPSMPSEVLNLEVTKTGIIEAEVSWSPPLLANGNIGNYTLLVYISQDDNSLVPFGDPVTQNVVPDESDMTEYSQSVGDLTPGQYYVFSVFSTNQVASSNERFSERIEFAETAPPPPPVQAIPQLVTRGATITINFLNLFDDRFGSIVRYAIIVRERVIGDTNVVVAKRQTTNDALTWATARQTRPVPAYQTTPNDYNPFANGETSATYTIGSESCDANDLLTYCNGALYSGTAYRFAVRAYGADGKFAETEFSAPFRTEPDRGIFVVPAIILAIIVVILLIIFMAMGFGCCGKPDGDMYPYVDTNGYSNGYGNGFGMNGNGNMKRALIDDGVNTYAYEQPQIMEHSFTNIPDYSTIAPIEGTTAQIHTPATTLSRPIKRNMFADHVANMSARNNAGFSDEYNSLPTMEKTRAVTIARQGRNADKNRYRNILPYDYTRVQLKGVVGNDYINANFIKDDHGNQKYIATQGPLPNTITHFWEMIWENQSGTIVMMTALVEGGKTKCEHYWPASEEPQLYGNVTVTLISSNQTDHFIERTLLLEKEGANRTVTHYQYTAWTDHGVPASTAPLVALLHQVRVTSQEDGSPSGPIVVHCSAGVGRTGTFIAADMLMDAIDRSTATDFIDVAGTVAKLREQRSLLVQTLYQYIYLHRTVQTLIEER